MSTQRRNPNAKSKKRTTTQGRRVNHGGNSEKGQTRAEREVRRNRADITDIKDARKQSAQIRRNRVKVKKGESRAHMMWVVIFVGILVYFIYSFFRLLVDESVAGYQVVAGSLSIDTVYRGIAIREEEEFYAFDAGYINYYASEGLKAGCGNMIYTLDTTGELSSILEDTEANRLTDAELETIRLEVLNYKNEFSEMNFDEVYDFQGDLNSLISRYRTSNIMENISSLNASQSAAVSLIRAEKSGIVVYKHDGFENLTTDTVTVADLDSSNYEPQVYTSNSLVASGDVVYKMITSEDWSIAIQIDETIAEKLAGENYVEVRFLKTQDKSWANMEIKRTPDGILLLLTFHNSVISFANERYVDIELILENEQGLKIPNSAIEEKEFYLIPLEYVTTGSTQNETVVLVEQYTEEGTLDEVAMPIEIYYETDAYYYASADWMKSGIYLHKTDSPIKVSTNEKDAQEIRDQYEPVQQSSVGIPSYVIDDSGEEIDYGNTGEALAEGTESGEQSEEPVQESQEATGEETTSVGETTQETSEQSVAQGDTVAESVTQDLGDMEEIDSQAALVQSNTADDRYVISAKASLIGVYNMNKGFADFKQITILYQNDEYAIISSNSKYGLQEYDYIVLNAENVTDNDLTYK